jgi:hypothetical protein
MVARAREHVVPLEDLVQHDAVQEAAEADAEQDPGAQGVAGERAVGADGQGGHGRPTYPAHRPAMRVA